MPDYAIRCRGLGLELGGQTIYERRDVATGRSAIE